jgi:hypothetical protein
MSHDSSGMSGPILEILIAVTILLAVVALATRFP